MNIVFINDCNQTVSLTSEFKESFIILPHNTVTITETDKSDLHISAKCEGFSYLKNCKYTLLIETMYHFTNISDVVYFHITHEKVRISPTIYFERLFLSADNAVCISQSYTIPDAEKIKKRFHTARLNRLLFFAPIEEMTGMVILLLMIGVFIIYKFGWKIAGIYFPLAYVFIVFFTQFLDIISRFIFEKKLFRMKSEKSEFYDYLDKKNIEKYYSNPNRTPFMGDIDTH